MNGALIRDSLRKDRLGVGSIRLETPWKIGGGLYRCPRVGEIDSSVVGNSRMRRGK